MKNAWTERVVQLESENKGLRDCILDLEKVINENCGIIAAAEREGLRAEVRRLEARQGMTAAEAGAVVRILVKKMLHKRDTRDLCERFLEAFPGYSELVARIWEEEFGERWK